MNPLGMAQKMIGRRYIQIAQAYKPQLALFAGSGVLVGIWMTNGLWMESLQNGYSKIPIIGQHVTYETPK